MWRQLFWSSFWQDNLRFFPGKFLYFEYLYWCNHCITFAHYRTRIVPHALRVCLLLTCRLWFWIRTISLLNMEYLRCFWLDQCLHDKVSLFLNIYEFHPIFPIPKPLIHDLVAQLYSLGQFLNFLALPLLAYCLCKEFEQLCLLLLCLNL